MALIFGAFAHTIQELKITTPRAPSLFRRYERTDHVRARAGTRGFNYSRVPEHIPIEKSNLKVISLPRDQWASLAAFRRPREGRSTVISLASIVQGPLPTRSRYRPKLLSIIASKAEMSASASPSNKLVRLDGYGLENT